MTNKERLEIILKGKNPDKPPHFELSFQLEKEMFGMKPIDPEDFSTEKELLKARVSRHNELQLRLIEEFDYAAVAPYDHESIAELKKAIDDRALVMDWSPYGVFWLPPYGSEGMDFTEFSVMM